MPSIGEIADWASIAGFVLTVVNTCALLWIGNRIRFNIRADQIIRSIDELSKSLERLLLVTDENRSDVMVLARRSESRLRSMRRLVDRSTKRTIDRGVEAAVSLAKAMDARALDDAANAAARRLFAELQGVREDLVALRDRRRAGS
jgi:low affinity Fe/Cu permease